MEHTGLDEILGKELLLKVCFCVCFNAIETSGCSDVTDLLGDLLGQRGAGGAGVSRENSVPPAGNAHFGETVRQSRRVGPQGFVTSKTPHGHVYLEALRVFFFFFPLSSRSKVVVLNSFTNGWS